MPMMGWVVIGAVGWVMMGSMGWVEMGAIGWVVMRAMGWVEMGAIGRVVVGVMGWVEMGAQREQQPQRGEAHTIQRQTRRTELGTHMWACQYALPRSCDDPQCGWAGAMPKSPNACRVESGGGVIGLDEIHLREIYVSPFMTMLSTFKGRFWSSSPVAQKNKFFQKQEHEKRGG